MNIKQLMVTFFIALLAGGEIGARVLTDKFVYSQGEKVVFTFDGKSEGKTIILKYLSKKGEPVLAEIGGEPFVWEVPSEFTPAAVGVYQKEEGQLTYSSYFRVVTPGMLTTYQIAKEEYKGLNVFMLNGGMSAEYTVQKSLANLTAGVSHTWQIGPGGGPKPVWGTPDFLQQSVQHTVDLYNEYLGKSKKLKTVIIATGVPAVPYLSAAMEAPVLPLHFLVSVNSTKEVSSILEYSSQAGVPCYATLGYDASMDDVGVAWIKLLALPDEYRKFIIEHEVENVIIAGIGEVNLIVGNLIKPEWMVRSMQTALFIFYIPNPVQSMTSKRYQEMSWTMIRYLLKKVRTWPIGRAVLSTGRLIIYQKVFVNILRHKFIL